jgi:hypothetical protein
MADALVVPTNIPWGDLTGEALEELVFWLADALGAKDLQWRVGATTHHASDGGRDLEATFHTPTPDDDVVAEHWWIQCKGRRKAVDRRLVQDAVADAEGVGGVDVVLVVTNSRFTNPTWDWVKSRGKTHRQPVVRLWDRERLERLLIRHPDVVARAAPEALSLTGRLASLTSQFWNQMYFPGPTDLSALWASRDSLDWDERALVAVTAAEIVNGDVSARPWAAWMNEQELLTSTLTVLINSLFLATRCNRFGIDTHKIIRLAAYLCLASVVRLNTDLVKTMLTNPWHFTEGDPFEPKVLAAMQKHLLNPVIGQIEGELGDVCSRNCLRVSTDVGTLTEAQATNSYWDRFILSDTPPPADSEKSMRLIIQSWEAPCEIGVIEGEEACPLFDDETPISARLEKIGAIVNLRIAQRSAAP